LLEKAGGFGYNEIMIKQKEIKAVVKKIAENYKPEKIYLFGSFAWGKPNYDSDVDLFIIKNTKEKWLQRHRKVRDLIDGVLPVDLLIYTPKETKRRLDMGDFFIEDILSKGKKIYDSESY